MDFITDNNPKGISYIKSILADKLPEYLKNETSVEELSKTASSAFADSKNREYPINNKANTWKSAAYFYTQGRFKMASEAADKVEKEIALAASLHGIANDVRDIIGSLETVVKKASDKSGERCKFAFTVNEQDGYYPINSEAEVMDAAAKVSIDKLGAYYYKIAATNIVNRANELNICSTEYLPEDIIENGKERLFNYENAKYAAEKRAEQTGCSLYNDIVDSAHADYMKGNCDVMKYASEMFKLDELYGIDKNYNMLTPDPFKALSQGVLKEDALKFANENVLLNDIFIPVNEFKSEKLKENIDIHFSKKVASELKSALASDSAIEISGKLKGLDKDTKIDLISLLVK